MPLCLPCNLVEYMHEKLTLTDNRSSVANRNVSVQYHSTKRSNDGLLLLQFAALPFLLTVSIVAHTITAWACALRIFRSNSTAIQPES
jgi:hypothetical protein